MERRRQDRVAHAISFLSGAGYGQQNIASLFYGPILLAAQESEPLKEWRKVTLNVKDISKSITGDPEKLQFDIDGVVYKPFYESYGRYSVYLDVTLSE
jgi:hypothetical protein